MSESLRLDRLLRRLGQGSRSQLSRLIRAGRVSVDGRAVTDPGTPVSSLQRIALDGVRLDSGLERHLMLNKPAGVLTAARDARHKTVLDLLPAGCLPLGCMPVGRLDLDSEGLLLFTTDGELAHRLLSPRRLVEKEYLVQVTGRLTENCVLAFARGLPLKDFTALPAELHILRAGEEESRARVVLKEGKHRQLRRMFEALGHRVTRLTRVRIGPLRLDETLAPGAFRELTPEEELALRRETGLA